MFLIFSESVSGNNYSPYNHIHLLKVSFCFSVRYDMNQDPYLLYTGKLYGSGPCLIALSGDGRTVAIAQETSIVICNSLTGKDEEIIENVHSGKYN